MNWQRLKDKLCPRCETTEKLKLTGGTKKIFRVYKCSACKWVGKKGKIDDLKRVLSNEHYQLNVERAKERKQKLLQDTEMLIETKTKILNKAVEEGRMSATEAQRQINHYTGLICQPTRGTRRTASWRKVNRELS